MISRLVTSRIEPEPDGDPASQFDPATCRGPRPRTLDLRIALLRQP